MFVYRADVRNEYWKQEHMKQANGKRKMRVDEDVGAIMAGGCISDNRAKTGRQMIHAHGGMAPNRARELEMKQVHTQMATGHRVFSESEGVHS